MFFRNVYWLSPDYTALYFRRLDSSYQYCLLNLEIITIYFVQLIVNLYFQMKISEIGVRINSGK
jgi:hypothetical protein